MSAVQGESLDTSSCGQKIIYNRGIYHVHCRIRTAQCESDKTDLRDQEQSGLVIASHRAGLGFDPKHAMPLFFSRMEN